MAGPVEMCRPVPAGQAAQLAAAVPALTSRKLVGWFSKAVLTDPEVPRWTMVAAADCEQNGGGPDDGPRRMTEEPQMPLDDFERYPLLFGPSPVHPLERLTRHLGGAAIWAKREDAYSALFRH